MVLTEITKPAVLPLELDGENGAKKHCVVEHSLHDQLLLGMIGAARNWGEAYTRRAFITQTFEQLRDEFPPSLEDEIELPLPPLQQVESVSYYDGAGVLTVWDPAEYVVTAPAGDTAERGSIRLAYGKSWPTPQIRPNAVAIRFTCGYGDASADVPAGIRCGLLIVVAELYKNREESVTGTIINRVPLAAENMLNPFRSLRAA